MLNSYMGRFTVASSLVVAGITITAPAFAEALLSSGTFQGRGGHATSGSVEVRKTEAGIVVVLGDDFSFDGAPDPKLGFGKNGYDPATKFSVLRSNSGKQEYLVTGIDSSQYNELWLWCERFSVPLGVAKLQ